MIHSIGLFLTAKWSWKLINCRTCNSFFPSTTWGFISEVWERRQLAEHLLSILELGNLVFLHTLQAKLLRWWYSFISKVWEILAGGNSICSFQSFQLPFPPKIEVCDFIAILLQPRRKLFSLSSPLLIEYFYSKKKRQDLGLNPRPWP